MKQYVLPLLLVSTCVSASEIKTYDCENVRVNRSEWIEVKNGRSLRMSWGMSSKPLTEIDDEDARETGLPLPRPSRLKDKAIYMLTEIRYVLIPDSVYKPTTKQFSITLYEHSETANLGRIITPLKCKLGRP